MISMSYEARCFELGRQFAYDLLWSSVHPREIAFDCDGVLGLFSIQEHPAHRDFYKNFAQGRPMWGKATQQIMPYFGASHYLWGMNSGPDGGPVLVSTMPVQRGVAIFKNTPHLCQAFVGEDINDLGVQHLNQSPRVFFARDLARGMCVLLDLESGKISWRNYPRGWWSEIERGIEAVHEHGDKLLKLPIVVALAKPGAPKPKVVVDDTNFIVEHLLSHSDAAVVQPSTPWGHHEAFHLSPTEALVRHHSHHMELLDFALRQALEDTTRERIRVECHHPDLIVRDTSRIFDYVETAGSLNDGFRTPVKILRRRLGLE